MIADDCNLILMNNRTRTPNLAEAADQINSMARMIIALQNAQAGMASSLPVSAPARSAALVARSLDSDFVISQTQDCIAIYTIELTVTASLLIGNSHADVSLLVNGQQVANPLADLTSSLTLGLSIVPKLRKVFLAYVPRGSTANLTTTTSGSGTATYISGQEILL